MAEQPILSHREELYARCRAHGMTPAKALGAAGFLPTADWQALEARTDIQERRAHWSGVIWTPREVTI